VADGRTYTLIGQISRLALSVIGASESEGAATEQRSPDGQPWQQWTAHYLGDGYFSLENGQSGLVLEVPSTDTASALPVRQAQWTGALKQQWRITSGPGAEAGFHLVANRETARMVDGLDGAEGAAVQQWPFIGNIPQQFWSFDAIGADDGSGDAGSGEPSEADGGTMPDGAAGSLGGSSFGGSSFGGAGNAAGSAFGGGVSAGGVASGFGPPTGSGTAGFTGDGSTAESANGPGDGCGCRLSPGDGRNHALAVLASLVLVGLRRNGRRAGPHAAHVAIGAATSTRRVAP
jgi:hypothetical protein